MTSITALTYSTSAYAGLASSPAGGSTAASTQAANAAPAATVTLSEAAKAVGQEKDFASVVAEVRAAIAELLRRAGATAPIVDGKATIDLAGLDRRQLFAMASNAAGRFSADEQALAAHELRGRFDSALAGPTGVARVTGDFRGLYAAAIAHYEAASAEEKATDKWKAEMAALKTGQAETEADPTRIRKDIPNDPVAAYLQRVTDGTAGQQRDFGDVAKDARAALDAQKARATAAGTVLVFDNRRGRGRPVDFSMLDNRALSAIGLDEDGIFLAEESKAASAELKSRNGAALNASLKAGAQGGDVTAFSQAVIGQYAAMSAEEREAAGWSPALYESAVANYKTSATLASMLGQLGGDAGRGNGLGGLPGLGGTSGPGPLGLSLLNFL